ncbi:hypothetical protein MyNCGM70_51050 [Achromobacter xylosoxidans]
MFKRRAISALECPRQWRQARRLVQPCALISARTTEQRKGPDGRDRNHKDSKAEVLKPSAWSMPSSADEDASASGGVWQDLRARFIAAAIERAV